MIDRWEYEEDLMYARRDAADGDNASAKCMRPGCLEREKGGVSFAKCAKCGSKFCSRECLRKDWKANHKTMCGEIQKFNQGFNAEMKRETIVRGVLGRIRLYVFPFLVHHRDAESSGCLFLQSPQPLEDFFFERNVTRQGERVSRQILATFVTQKEFQEEIISADFEMALAAAAVSRALDSDETKAPVLLRFRCGYIAVLVANIVPDLAVCRKLGEDYVGKNQIQLNIDDI